MINVMNKIIAIKKSICLVILFLRDIIKNLPELDDEKIVSHIFFLGKKKDCMKKAYKKDKAKKIKKI